MALTHTWKIKEVVHDATSKKIKEIHWRLDSKDGNHISSSYGSIEINTDIPIQQESINTTLAINIIKNQMGDKHLRRIMEKNRNRINSIKNSTLTKGVFWKGGAVQSEVDDTLPANAATYTTPDPDITFVVTVAAKTTSHSKYGVGSTDCFLIDGVEDKALTFTPGTIYRFNMVDASNAGHPLRFYITDDKNGMYLAGTSIRNEPGSAGSYIQMEVPTVDPLTSFYYQCENHDNMGGTVSVVIPS